MSRRIVYRYGMACDGCGVERGTSPQEEAFRSAVEARSALYGQGWRFPARFVVAGKKKLMTADLCPKCVEELL